MREAEREQSRVAPGSREPSLIEATPLAELGSLLEPESPKSPAEEEHRAPDDVASELPLVTSKELSDVGEEREEEEQQEKEESPSSLVLGSEGERRGGGRQLSPEIPLLPPLIPEKEVREEEEGEREEEGEGEGEGEKDAEDSESVASSISSKPPTPLPSVVKAIEEIVGMVEGEEEGKKEEAEEVGEEGKEVELEEEVEKEVEEDVGASKEEIKGEGMEVVEEEEEDVELADIEKQLQLSDSDESDTSSESDMEPGHSVPGSELLPGEKEESLTAPNISPLSFLPPPPRLSSSLHSSSHSLASTPSISPTPSPIPHSTPIQSPGSIPPPPPMVTTRTEMQTKSDPLTFLGPPTTTVPPGNREVKSAPTTLVVRFKKHLIASLSKGKEGGRRPRVNPQPTPVPSPLTSVTVSTSPVKKVKSLLVTSSAAPPPASLAKPPARPVSMVVSLPRSQLHHARFGLSLTHASAYEDDVIVTNSSRERVKLGQGSSVERVKHRFSRHSAVTPPEERAQPAGGGWKREVDISEMGLLGSAPKKPKEEPQVLCNSLYMYMYRVLYNELHN